MGERSEIVDAKVKAEYGLELEIEKGTNCSQVNGNFGRSRVRLKVKVRFPRVEKAKECYQGSHYIPRD